MKNEIEEYKSRFLDLKKLIDCSEIISNYNAGKKVDSDLEILSLIFIKNIAHAKSLILLAPKQPFNNTEIELWDLSSLAAICRCIIDGYYKFYYIGIEDVDIETKNFRLILWDYHSEYRRLEKLKLIKAEKKKISQIEKILNEIKGMLLKNSYFMSLNKKLQSNLIDGNKAVLYSNIELSSKIGIDKNYYKAIFMFLSSYIHSLPFSIDQLLNFRANNEQSLNQIKIILEYATIYLSLTLLDFLEIFPDMNNRLDQDTLNIALTWKKVAFNYSKY